MLDNVWTNRIKNLGGRANALPRDVHETTYPLLQKILNS